MRRPFANFQLAAATLKNFPFLDFSCDNVSGKERCWSRHGFTQQTFPSPKDVEINTLKSMNEPSGYNQAVCHLQWQEEWQTRLDIEAVDNVHRHFRENY